MKTLTCDMEGVWKHYIKTTDIVLTVNLWLQEVGQGYSHVTKVT